MNNNKKRKTSGRVPVTALLSPQRSIVLIDPKTEWAAVTRAKAKNSGAPVLHPFIVLPPDQPEACAKWFRLCIGAAFSDLINAQKKEGYER
jgi:hypothetical protein